MKSSPEQKCGDCLNSRKLTDTELGVVEKEFGHQFNPRLNHLCSLENKLVSKDQMPQSLLDETVGIDFFNPDAESCFSPRTEVLILTGKVS